MKMVSGSRTVFAASDPSNLATSTSHRAQCQERPRAQPVIPLRDGVSE
jgi:hypothetical protein